MLGLLSDSLLNFLLLTTYAQHGASFLDCTAAPRGAAPCGSLWLSQVFENHEVYFHRPGNLK